MFLAKLCLCVKEPYFGKREYSQVIMENAVSGMLHRVAPVSTDISEEYIAAITRVTRIGELGTLAVTTNRSKPSCKSHTAHHSRRHSS
jgi:hypothetical protein